MLTLLGSKPKEWILLINSPTWWQLTPIPSLFCGCTPTTEHRTVVQYAKLCSNRYSMSLFISASSPSPLDPPLRATNSLSLSLCFCSIFAGWDLWKSMFRDFTLFGILCCMDLHTSFYCISCLHALDSIGIFAPMPSVAWAQNSNSLILQAGLGWDMYIYQKLHASSFGTQQALRCKMDPYPYSQQDNRTSQEILLQVSLQRFWKKKSTQET